VKVRCERLAHLDGSTLIGSDALDIGKEYIVLSVLTVPNGRIQLQILFPDGHMSWWTSEIFSVSSDTISPNWVADIDDKGIMRLGPRPFLTKGLLEDFYNDDPIAVQIVDSEVAKMTQEYAGPDLLT
jgi:hypothetical protein